VALDGGVAGVVGELRQNRTGDQLLVCVHLYFNYIDVALDGGVAGVNRELQQKTADNSNRAEHWMLKHKTGASSRCKHVPLNCGAAGVVQKLHQHREWNGEWNSTGNGTGQQRSSFA
jgi:hypothetical protein